MNGETAEERQAARMRGYRERVLGPSEEAQKRYPLEDFPCGRCERDGLPHLVNNRSGFYWEHGPGGGRSGCPRFGDSEFCGNHPRAGTATSLWWGRRDEWHPRTEEEYLRAFQATEEQGADDQWERERLPSSW